MIKYRFKTEKEKTKTTHQVRVAINNTFEYLTFYPTNFNYDNVVNKLISIKYPNDKMQAVINNYLLDSDDEKSAAEFNEMQDYRKDCKQIAKEILETYKASLKSKI